MAVPRKIKSPKRPGKDATAGPDRKEMRRQAVEPDVKSTGGLATGPIANPKCALPESITIVVVDDHPLFRHGLSTLLNASPDFEVVGEATSGEEVVTTAAKLQPDVVLMDIHMPGGNGIEATRRILHTSPHIRILIITMFEDDASVFTAMRAGARGYVLKDAQKADMLAAIRAVGRGEAVTAQAVILLKQS